MKILAIIPARGNSKGIKKKNLRLFNGKPLISYIVSTLKKVNYITDVVVNSEDEEILNYSSSLGIKTHKRPDLLSQDDVTLDPVIFEAYSWYRGLFGEVDAVLTAQPTSPLVSSGTVEDAINKFLDLGVDTVISSVDDTHLCWTKQGEDYIPDYKERVNRQYLPKRLKETGAFVITKSSFVSPHNRNGNKVYLYEVPQEESIDIDTDTDWITGEALASRLSILIVTFANGKVGTGHLNRSLSLANAFLGHRVEFAIFDTEKVFREILDAYGYPYRESGLNDIMSLLDNNEFDLVINDILDTKSSYIEGVKKRNKFLVNFEDLGDGSKFADVVFNDMYGGYDIPPNYRIGYRYAVLDESFLLHKPNNFNDIPKNILLSFGGVDQNNLTSRVLDSIKDIVKERDLKVKVIIGQLYPVAKELKNFIEKNSLNSNITVLQNVKNMASEMSSIDLAFTSNGRTVYELASMRVPVVSIAQNDRETLHLFARTNPGVKYLGIACTVSKMLIKEIFVYLLDNTSQRKLMYDSLPYKEIRNGLLNVKNEIMENYRRFKRSDNKDW